MSACYPYPEAVNGRYVLLHAGVEKLRGTEQELWQWLHRHTPQSVHWAILYEGYEIKPEEQA